MGPKYNVKYAHSHVPRIPRIGSSKVQEHRQPFQQMQDALLSKKRGSRLLSTKPTEVCPNTQYNAGMESPHDNERRLTDLEVKSTFTEDLVDRLNQEVIRQQRHIDILVREIRELRQQIAQTDNGIPPGPRDELPPHY
jgi:SlyX protein